MTNHVVVDLETLDLSPGAVVLSIGAVVFRFGESPTFDDLVSGGYHVALDRVCQTDRGRTIGKETVEWWVEQTSEARGAATDNAIGVVDAISGLNDWLDSVGFDKHRSWVWARGPHFDIPILRDLERTYGVKSKVFDFRVRDSRTYIDILTGSSNGKYDLEIPGWIKHHALHDAAADALTMLEIQRKLGE